MSQERARWAIYNLRTFILFAPVNTKGINVVVSRKNYFDPKDEDTEFILLEIHTTKLDRIKKHLSEKLLKWYIENIIYSSSGIYITTYHSDCSGSNLDNLFRIGKKLIEDNEQRAA